MPPIIREDVGETHPLHLYEHFFAHDLITRFKGVFFFFLVQGSVFSSSWFKGLTLFQRTRDHSTFIAGFKEGFSYSRIQGDVLFF